jgi:hypothetical protein
VVHLLAPAVVVAVCAGATAPYWPDRPRWSPDSLFYEARVLELRGVPPSAAVDQVFFGKIGTEFRRSNGIAASVPTLTNDRAWISYTREFYKRRQVVPILAAAAYPVLGERSLAVVSLVGYFVTGLLLYVLLGLRFSTGVSLAVTCLFVLLQPMRDFSLYPLTDSWGVAAIAMTMIASVVVFDRGLRWLPWWILSVALLSVTRDAVVIVVGAALISAVLKRGRVSTALALSGVVAMLPSVIAFPLPIRQFLAYGLSGNKVPSNDGWRFIAAHYWPNFDGMVREYWTTMAAGGLLTAAILIVLAAAALLQPAAIANRSLTRIAAAVAVAFVALVTASTGVGGSPLLGQRLPAVLILLGGAALLAVWPRTDAAADYLRASAGAALVFIAIFPEARGLRNELVLVPCAALGVALTVQRLGWLLATAGGRADVRIGVSRTSSSGVPT